ncbi:MAG: catechol 1,2-dioxygenase [Alphaproteobacteria bacterium]|jgi:catechol 1,2-dioxygenase|nr:catechol 1,2-dioxygenase [Alphaproteobacteria bacterium]
MHIDFIKTAPVQALFDRAAGLDRDGGDARLKAIVRDLTESIAAVIVRHDISEDEFWCGVNYLASAAPEFGLLVPGTGLEHFMDLFLDAKDEEVGRTGGTPRTIEGPLYVAGAPLAEGEVNLTKDPDETSTLRMYGTVRGPDGELVKDAILHVWHADSKGWYSHFDPTKEQSPFNNRARIKLGDDATYSFYSKMPEGYAVPPHGSTNQLMQAIGRHGKRPAHVHFFIEAPGYRQLTTQINFGDDPFANDDFAFATREGLLPMPNRQGDTVTVSFDFELQKAVDEADQVLSVRARAAA